MSRALADAQRAVTAFHLRFGQTVGDTPAVRDPVLRARLLREECQETVSALMAGDLVEVADGLCDLIYVALGTAVACGVDLSPLYDAVHASNMAKVGGGVDAGGKITKPEGWQPPAIAELLRAQGWKGDGDGR